ncbi:glycosyltransferase [Domibacillus enclensis]|uniref:Glycosyltransferase, catalytic subunit of cellulose synthase and poly-beta-1,6-N-acetylglucosamine synthase n=1 Tax=Domibacillus enclensis TaxID=1017273 RepID=A0A1N6NZG7_9BACI|nr:glycosyltransferase family 2 protein [Domibacillus enclensis]OXS80192.1 hypothetical protein B1B05_01560 [Domibacillus enclensis]SIP97504.1 Glycosyltransferase, catalytic subunit of cellulose synthase and poly-beta-1,6-N-acetylglucosamine synthase [Domibacillus enclensis]
MIIYSGLLALFCFMTIVNIASMPRLKRKEQMSGQKLSVLIPMRNEERNAAAVIQSVQSIHWPNLECIVLNDGSTDRTEERLIESIGRDQRFTIVNGKELPEGWVGKVHACHQLGKRASGDYLLFLDADVRVKPVAIIEAVTLLQKRSAGLLSGFARFPARPVLAKLLVPMQPFFVFFHLPVLLANWTKWAAASAAHGGFMLFTREAYEAAGGHQSVKGSLVEDVHIMRNVKKAGHKAMIANIAPSVTCTMYETNAETWEGFLKNTFNGLGRSKGAAALLILFYAVFYVAPLFLLFAGYWLPYLLIVLQKLLVDAAARQSLWYAPFMPLSAAAFIVLLLSAMTRPVHTWKGRTYSNKKP